MKELEKIEKDIQDFIDGGLALWRQIAERLRKIRDRELWKEDYKSFKDYVEKRWGRDKSWAYRLMQDDAKAKQLTESGVASLQLPKQITHVSASAVREIAKVPDEKRAEVIAATNGHITAKAVEKAAKPPAVEDDMGTIIPKAILPTWERRGEIKELMQMISDVRCEIESKKKSADRLFGAISVDVTARLDLAYEGLASAYPQVVCGVCEGLRAKDVCAACRSTGFQSRRTYEHIIPKEDREMRKSSINQRRNATKGLSAGVSRLNH